MVCNLFKVLDENEIKQLSIIDYNMKKPKYVYDFELEIATMNFCYQKYKQAGASYQDAVNRNLPTKSHWEEEYPNICREWKTYQDNEFLYNYLFEKEVNSKLEWNKIAKYYNIIPFVPSVMINISPDWESCDKRSIPCKIKILKGLIDSYMKEQWYQKWSYVIENGSDGKHIHAHIVAEFNTKRIKSVESHLRKGNHTQQLKKYAKKIKGIEGMIKGVSVQKMFLRTEEIVNDKLDYLIESKKPEGHKNLSVINDGYVTGCL